MTKKTEIPEIIMQATKKRAENRTQELITFLSPIHSEEADELIRKAKNLEASADFAEETFEAWIQCNEVLRKIEKFKDMRLYCWLTSTGDLADEQQELLRMLWLANDLATEVGNDLFSLEVEGEEKKLIDNMLDWVEAVKGAIKIILESLANEFPKDIHLQKLLNKTQKLVSVLESFKKYN